MSEDTLHHPLKDLCIRICNFAKYHCGNYDLLDSDYNFIKSLENMAFDYLDYHYIGEEDFEALNTFYDIYNEEGEKIYNSDFSDNNSEGNRDKTFDSYGNSNNYFQESQSDNSNYDSENFDRKWNEAKNFSANWKDFDSNSENSCPNEQYDRLDQTDHNDTDNIYSEGEDYDYQHYDENYEDENHGLYVTLKTYEGKKSPTVCLSKNSINF